MNCFGNKNLILENHFEIPNYIERPKDANLLFLLNLFLKNLDDESIDCSPFCILSKSKNIVFESSSFSKIEESIDDLLPIIHEKIEDDSLDPFMIQSFKIYIHKLFDNDAFFISIKINEKKEKDSKYSIMRCCHDINEPLRNISNLLQIIKLQMQSSNTEERDDCNEYINLAIDNALSLKNFVSDLLYENEISFQSTFTVKDIIDEIKKLLKIQIEQRDCIIKVNNPDLFLKGNYCDIISLFKNLIENSLKYAKANKLVIKISIRNVNDLFVVQFKDNGSSILDESKNKIEKALEEECSHESFGLSICKMIAKKYSGSIEFLKGKVSGCAYKLTLQFN